jgi:hypothetical protein
MGRPAINTVFNHGNDKNIFDVTEPADQRATPTTSGQTFLQVFTSELEMLGGYTASQADAIARVLLPDILTFDFSSSQGFLNGRRLQDDVIDISLNLVTNGKITSDGVGPLKFDIERGLAAEWIHSTFQYAAEEVAAGRPGSETGLAKLSELLFVEAVRRYAETLSDGQTGSLAGLRDNYVARALALIHRDVTRAWTVDELGREQRESSAT